MEFNRVILSDIRQWASTPKAKPLLLQGARQVGKTTLLKQAGKQFFEQTVYINLEEQPDLITLFEQTKSAQKIVDTLSVVTGQSIIPGKTLLIIDEIQNSSNALLSLKYFNENLPQLKVAAAGSLLGVTLGGLKGFPVGKVHFKHLYPLTFIEFLNAADIKLYEAVKKINTPDPIPEVLINKLNDYLTQYFICGGMPESAKTWLETHDIVQVQAVLNDILNAYRLDFSKHAQRKDIQKIDLIWQSIPSQLARENKKFVFQLVREGARAREYEDALQWLSQAGLIYKLNRIEKPHLPITTYEDKRSFKVYLCDVGLLRHMAGLQPSALLLNNPLMTEFKGALAENFVLQNLITENNAIIRYWSSTGQAEVDFVIQMNDHVFPIEVKSSTNIRSKSLSVYDEKYHPELKIRFSMLNLKKDVNTLNMPLSMINQLRELVSRIV